MPFLGDLPYWQPAWFPVRSLLHSFRSIIQLEHKLLVPTCSGLPKSLMFEKSRRMDKVRKVGKIIQENGIEKLEEGNILLSSKREDFFLGNYGPIILTLTPGKILVHFIKRSVCKQQTSL